MEPNLVELGAMLNKQLPVLVSFVMLRLLCVGTFKTLLPRSVKTYGANAADLYVRTRAVVMLVAMINLVAQVVYEPIAGMCHRYESVKAQGTSAMLALVVLMSSNDLMASAVALGALRAVATASPSSLLWSTSAVVFTTRANTALYAYVLLMMALTHAVYCHRDEEPTQTHGSTIVIIAIAAKAVAVLFACACTRAMVVNARLFGALKTFLERLKYRHNTHEIRETPKAVLAPPPSPVAKRTSVVTFAE